MWVESTHICLPMKMEQTECSETSAYKLQTPGNYPKESIQHTERGESLKLRITFRCKYILFSFFFTSDYWLGFSFISCDTLKFRLVCTNFGIRSYVWSVCANIVFSFLFSAYEGEICLRSYPRAIRGAKFCLAIDRMRLDVTLLVWRRVVFCGDRKRWKGVKYFVRVKWNCLGQCACLRKRKENDDVEFVIKKSFVICTV